MVKQTLVNVSLLFFSLLTSLVASATEVRASGIANSAVPKTPNLSVTLPEEVETTLPNRAKRIFALEKANRERELRELDELDQDLLYMRLLKSAGQEFDEKFDQEEHIGPVPFKKGAKTILFFDTNFGPSEIRAARAVALARGENLIVVPERTEAQQDEIEREYRLMISLGEQIKRCNASGNQNCSQLSQKWNESYERLNLLTAQITKFTSANLDELFADLTKLNVQLSAIIFSGHSGGGGAVGGLFGGVDSKSTKESFDKYPEPLKTVTSILIWGCYSGTLDSLSEHWQKLFPSVKGFIGYRNQAPLGIRESSGKLLKGYLLNEAQIISTSNSSDSHQAFRALPGVANLDATAIVGENYYTYDRSAKVEDLIKICDNFDETHLQNYKCYNDALPGCENPPADHRGPLRTFYSFLQVNRHCQEKLRSKYQGIPTPEALVRLIFVDTIKDNFANHYNKLFQSFSTYLAELGISSEVRFENFVGSKRVDDIKRLAVGLSSLENLGMRDLSYLDRTGWRSVLIFQKSLYILNSFLARDYFIGQGYCVPFSWVEPDAQDHDTCGLTKVLSRPISDSLEADLLRDFYFSQHLRWNLDNNPGVWSLNYRVYENLIQLREIYQSDIQWSLQTLSQLPNRSKSEDQRLLLYTTLLDSAKQMSDVDLARAMLLAVENAIANAEQMAAQAHANPLGEMAVRQLGWMIDAYKETKVRIDSLLTQP